MKKHINHLDKSENNFPPLEIAPHQRKRIKKVSIFWLAIFLNQNNGTALKNRNYPVFWGWHQKIFISEKSKFLADLRRRPKKFFSSNIFRILRWRRKKRCSLRETTNFRRFSKTETGRRCSLVILVMLWLSIYLSTDFVFSFHVNLYSSPPGGVISLVPLRFFWWFCVV